MLDFVKRNKITVIILIATVILGGIAIFTAIRLYSLRSQRVAPTAPESMPAAADIITNECELSVTRSGEVTGCNDLCDNDSDCTETDQFCHDTDNDGTPDRCRLIDYPEEEDCEPPITLPTECNDECTTDSECEDVNADYECYDSDGAGDLRCRHTNYPDEVDCTPADDDIPIDCNDTCDSNGECEDVNASYICYDSDDAGDFRCRHEDYPDETNCSPPAEDLIECDDECTSNSECPDSLVCNSSSNSCRNPDCINETDCVCPDVDDDIECNDACSDDSECPGSMECINDRCRNPNCPTETDCICPAGGATPTPTTTTLTPTPTPVGLPEAGVSLPTMLGIGTSFLLLVGAALLIL